MRFKATFLKAIPIYGSGNYHASFLADDASKEHPNYEKKFNFLLRMWYAIMHNLCVYPLTNMIGLQAAP